MRIASFDLGNTTGWARWDPAHFRSGIVDLSLKDDEHPGERWRRARQSLEAIAQGANVLLWERVVGRHRTAANLYVFESYLVEICHVRDIDAATVAPSTLKKFATGSGKSKNPEVLRAAHERWPGYSFATHDEAHARFIVVWYLQIQKEVLSA